ncbi:MAG: HAMP domain-containing protein, partial [Deltaproteobacteria bacterium]|nr:HAMP domain-containing protein [Deltaproteobacteria bacterium]
MSLKKLLKLHATLAFRLTFWYTAIFVISFFLAFLGIYFLIVSTIQERVDQELLSDKTEFVSLLVYGLDKIKNEIKIETDSEGADKIFFRILTLTGEELAASNLASWGNIEIDQIALTSLNSGMNYVFQTIKIPKHHHHKARILYSIIGSGKILQVGQSLKDDECLLESFRELFGTTMIILTVFSALTGWFMAKRALKGIGRITSTAIEISDGALEKRVPVNLRGDEIDRLAITFNSMLDRINTLINEMKEMTDNIAHDLKSPLTRIRGLAEIVLTTGKSMDEFKEMAAGTIEECDYLMEMINTMLIISEMYAKLNNLDMVDID